MKIRQICFPEVGKVVYQEVERDLPVGPDDVLIRTLYSAVSAGTELAKYTGLQDVKYPFIPGNRAVGEVVEVGEKVEDFRPGDNVFTHTTHVSHAKATKMCAKVPDGVDLCHAPLIGLALVAITAVRVAKPELGDRALVTGMGLVGNFCAQFLKNSGVEVIVADTVEARLEAARACGVAATVNPAEKEAPAKVMEFSCGHGVEYVIEATGNPVVMDLVTSVNAKQGEVILLGSPRGEHQTDVVPLLNAVHLWRDHGCVTMKGAHEWRFPLYPDGYSKHSMKRNAEIIFRMMADGRLKTGPLVTHVLKPEQAEQAFDGLMNRKNEYLGVIFDWTGEEMCKR
ncbi:MAG: zinc-binding alcohol dehydrogenase [Planctomycetes bacterium]|nr:zinc-binding alcohol dehydrogenase [Planctomycetota bacterium]